MTTRDSQTPKSTIYPDYCHSLSPTISRWCPLRALDVHALRGVGMYIDGRELYHFSNHPIKWVRITGVVVAIDEFAERKIITLDDSSGMCIECVCACPTPTTQEKAMLGHLNQNAVAITDSRLKNANEVERKGEESRSGKGREIVQPSIQNPKVPWDDLDVGSVLKVKGQIGKWWDMKQIEVIKIEVMRGTEQEVRCWDEVLAFRRDVLNKSWIVSAEEEERCRKEKEREVMRRKKGGRTTKSGESGDARRKRKRDEVKEDELRKKKRMGDVGETRREKPTYDERIQKSKKGKEREADTEGLDPVDKTNYPSLAARRRAAGKYDALGI